MSNDESKKLLEMLLAATTVIGVLTAIFHWAPK